MKSLPNHIAIIMDGNGRWAKHKGYPLISGHKKGADVAFQIAQTCAEQNISWLTLYTFSTENWQRPKSWLLDFHAVLEWYLENELNKLLDHNVKLYIIGDFKKFPARIVELIDNALEKTRHNTALNLVLALNYGGRDELTTMVKKIIQQGLSQDEISQETVKEHLYTQGIPDPDIIIRTSGEQRLSNFLLWQAAYSEFFFTQTLWPDFTKEEFQDILTAYQSRERRYGLYHDH